MFRGFMDKFLHREVRQYRCTQCSYIFGKPQKECPHCRGKVVEIMGKIENK